MANDIKVGLSLDREGFKKDIKSAEGTASKGGLSLGKALAGPLKAAAGAAIAGALSGVVAIRAAAQQEKAVQALNTSLKTAGTFSEEASKSFQDLARSLQANSVFGDELILQQAALARNFTQTNEQAELLTKASVDLASATGMSLDSAIKNLGKTFAGLTGELGESLPGIRAFTAEQLKSGAALEYVLDRFAGSAAGEIQTFSGRMTQLGNVFGDFLESLGNLIIKSPAVLAVMGKISDLFLGAGESVREFGKGRDVFGDLVKGAISFAIGINKFVVAPLELAFNLIKTGGYGAIAISQAIFDSFVKVFGWIGEKLASLFGQKLPESFKKFSDGSTEALQFFTEKAIESGAKVTSSFEVSDSINGFLTDLQLAVETASPLYDQLTAKAVAANRAMSGPAPDILEQQIESFTQFTTDIGKALDGFSKKVKVTMGQVAQTMITSVANGAGSAFAAFGKAIASGENALQAFLNTFLASMGQMVIQLGTQFILMGIAYTLAKMPNGPPLIAAGAALAAFGGVLSALGSGGAGGAATPSAGGSLEPGGITTPENDFIEDPEDVSRETGPRIDVRVEGNVLDSEESGIRIVQMINDAFDTSGATVRGNA